MPRCQTPDTTGLRAAPTGPVEAADPQRSHDSAGADAKAAPGPLTLVAAYARVSTDRQDREQTIDSQVDALRRAAEQRGWHLSVTVPRPRLSHFRWLFLCSIWPKLLVVPQQNVGGCVSRTQARRVCGAVWKMKDRPFEVGFREQASNHPKRHRSKAVVVSVGEKIPVRCGSRRRA
jgi:hypothetical protein